MRPTGQSDQADRKHECMVLAGARRDRDATPRPNKLQS